MRIKGALLILVGLAVGLISHSIKERINERLTDKCEISDEQLIIRKGIIRNDTDRISYENITTIRFETGFSDRILGKERLKIVTTSPHVEHISIITDYGTAEKIRTRVEEEWEE